MFTDNALLPLSVFFRRVRKIAKSDCQLRYICPFVGMERLGYYWADSLKIRYLSAFPKYFLNNQVTLISDKNNGYFTGSPVYVVYSESTVCAYLSRFLETVTLRMCSDFLYQFRSHRRHFVKFVLCLCLFLCVKHV